MRSIDFEDVLPILQRREVDGTLVTCEYFDVKVKEPTRQGALGERGEHLTFAVVRGSLEVAGQTWTMGDFGLVPACLPWDRRLIMAASADAAWLEVRVP
jgi:hypothetical protein